MVAILHYLKVPELWELWYVPYFGQCRVYIIIRSLQTSEVPGAGSENQG